MSEVEYRAVPGFPGYRVGDDGSVWTQKRGGNSKQKMQLDWKPMAIKKHKRGDYLIVTLTHQGCGKGFLLHRLVLLCFVGPPPEGKPMGLHEDDNKTNNTPTNLYWGTHKQNMQDAMRNGKTTRGNTNGCVKLTEDQVKEIKRLRAEEGLGSRRLAKRFGVVPQTIQLILSGVNWAHIEDQHATEFCIQGDTIRGTRNPSAAMSERDVRHMRELYRQGWTQIRLADLFKVKQTTVSAIVLRKTWKHVV